MSTRRGVTIGGLAGALVLALALAACAGTAEHVVVRVGDEKITSKALEHWMSVMGAGDGKPQPLLRRRTLQFLISADWLIGEARAQRLSLSGPQFQQRLQERRLDALALGEGEFRQAIAKTGRTVADVRMEIAAELASAKIRAKVIGDVGTASQAEIASYYHSHKVQFLNPERRYFDIYNFHTVAAAMKLKREVQAGKDFAKISFHEYLERGEGVREPDKAAIERAVFTAAPGVLLGPVELYGEHSIFDLTKIVPREYKSLAQVHSAIAAQLTSERRQQALGAFAALWRSRWIAKTDCSTGFVVQKCRQYFGPRTREDPVALD